MRRFSLYRRDRTRKSPQGARVRATVKKTNTCLTIGRANGLPQLIAGTRNFRLSAISRRDVICLTEEAEQILAR